MSTQSPVAAAAMLVSLALAATILERWIDRRRPQDLAWATSLGLFAAGAGALWWGASTGWSPVSFRAFYAFGAVLNVPILALGTIYLLADRRVADRITVVTVLACTFAAGVVMAAPLTGPLADQLASGSLTSDELPQGSAVFGAGPRVAAAVASSVGALVVIVGSTWSMIRLRRIGGPVARRGATGNGLIVAGALVLSWGGLLNSILDEMTGFAVSLLVGISLIFAGTLTATGARQAS
ncbi:MAG: hypothetical protein VYD11_04965 [Actinomycetota bacterium]|nr:hypothetical protein [Actinomycetota bacterium]MEE3354325.1 hypothetical protein [Actinomycetota bacterium]